MLPDAPGAKVQYFTATTLDGFIADADNSLDWLFAVERDEDDGSWNEFIDGVGALVMGATTYEWVLGHEPEMLSRRTSGAGTTTTGRAGCSPTASCRASPAST